MVDFKNESQLVFTDSQKEIINKNLICSDDGYYFYYATKEKIWSADQLRLIADELDKKNKDWNDQINEELKKIDQDQSSWKDEVQKSIKRQLDQEGSL